MKVYFAVSRFHTDVAQVARAQQSIDFELGLQERINQLLTRLSASHVDLSDLPVNWTRQLVLSQEPHSNVSQDPNPTQHRNFWHHVQSQIPQDPVPFNQTHHVSSRPTSLMVFHRTSTSSDVLTSSPCTRLCPCLHPCIFVSTIKHPQVSQTSHFLFIISQVLLVHLFFSRFITHCAQEDHIQSNVTRQSHLAQFFFAHEPLQEWAAKRGVRKSTTWHSPHCAFPLH